MASKIQHYSLTLDKSLFVDPEFKKSTKYSEYFPLKYETINHRLYSELTTSSQVLLPYLVSLSYRHSALNITVNDSQLPRFRRVNTDDLLTELSKFGYLQYLKENKESKETNKIKENKEKTPQPPAAETFDIEILYYEIYPNKKGKSAGLKKLHKQIKSAALYENLKKAMTNFAEEMRLNETPAQFIKHFSTFASEWTDWVDFVPAKRDGQRPARKLSNDIMDQATRLGGVNRGQ